jgi:hypothetical protein
MRVQMSHISAPSSQAHLFCSNNARCWDKALNPSVMFSIFAPDEGTQEKVLDKMLTDKELKVKFQTEFNFTTEEQIRENKKTELKQIGCHPADYYAIYVTDEDLEKMYGLQNEPRKLPDLESVKEVDKILN